MGLWEINEINSKRCEFPGMPMKNHNSLQETQPVYATKLQA